MAPSPTLFHIPWTQGVGAAFQGGNMETEGSGNIFVEIYHAIKWFLLSLIVVFTCIGGSVSLAWFRIYVLNAEETIQQRVEEAVVDARYLRSIPAFRESQIEPEKPKAKPKM